MLLKRHDPVTIMLQNNAGETPLHVACRCGVPFESVQSLVHHYKASVQVATPQRDLCQVRIFSGRYLLFAETVPRYALSLKPSSKIVRVTSAP
jgi:hypothetical protein